MSRPEYAAMFAGLLASATVTLLIVALVPGMGRLWVLAAIQWIAIVALLGYWQRRGRS